MAHHVAVGEVDCDEGVGVRLQPLQQGLRDGLGIHFGVAPEGCGVEAARNVHLILAGVGDGRLAVEEARHVAELLRLGDAQLAQARAGDDLAEQVVHAAVGIHRPEQVVLELVPVAGEAEVGDLRPARALSGVVVADESLGELDGAILAVVGVHDAIAVAHTVIAADHVAGDVLVGHLGAVRRAISRVGGLDGAFGVGGGPAPRLDEAGKGGVRQGILARAVHGVVAAHHGADAAAADLAHLEAQASQVLERAAGRGVAPVEEWMDDDLARRVLAPGAAHDLEEMLLVGVDALVLEQAEQVEASARALPVGDQALPLGGLEQLPAAEAVVDALEFLDDHAAGAHVQMADLARSLVAFRQADGFAAAGEA